MSDFSAVHGAKPIEGIDWKAVARKMANDMDTPLFGLLDVRERTHGNYPEQTVTAQGLKYLIRSAPNWEAMTPAMRESLEMICTKIARILHGDPSFEDAWIDVAGYAELVRKTL